jgi:Uma2 family endonuclease
MGMPALKIEDFPYYTYDDYVQWEGQWEIIKGIPYAMTPAPSPKHQRISLKIASQLDELLSNCSDCKTYQAIDWRLTDDTVVQPDVLVVCGSGIKGNTLTVPPVLAVEILSPSTSRKDKFLKHRLYEHEGVKYYCIVDPDSNHAIMFHIGDNQYRQLEDFKDGKITMEIGKCLIEFDFAKVFKEL